LLACCHSYCNATQTTQSVTLAWNQSPSANIVGYNIYYGGASGNYTNMVSVGNVTNTTISGLLGGVTYYFAAAAINSSGFKSGYSSQISFVPPVTTTTNRPLLSITNVISGMVVSNAAFTAMGNATDNIAVADVYYSLDNSPFIQAATPSQWTWKAALALTAGTNTFTAYAVDTSGNISTTSTVNIVYAPYMTLTIQTNGQGSVSPNYSGALLQLGKTYSMTATSINGFMFTNWTGGASGTFNFYTNGPTVTFTMISNLVMRANFVDTSKPWLSITNVTPGMQTGNTTFTVAGQATDNVAVASVYYSLDSTPFKPAVINGANWSAALSLTPGTNTIAAYDVDNSGNISATNTVSFDCLLTAPLTVQTNGQGNINPIYNGSLLQIGKPYSMTASGINGFMFTNWTGGVSGTFNIYTNGPTVTFSMISNLVMRANFVDTNAPWLSITNVSTGMQVSNTMFTVAGQVTDNVAVASVYYSLDNAPYTQAVINGANWGAALMPASGTNTFAAYAIDTNGNISTTDQVNFVCVQSGTLTVQTHGNALIYPNYSNAVLRVGQNYTVTAYPYNGFIFSNWTESTGAPFQPCGNYSTVTFMMQTNLTLQANLIEWSKPTLTISSPLSGTVMTNPQPTVVGTTTDPWQVAGVSYSLNNGPWTLATTTNNFTNWTSSVALNVGTNTFSAYAMNLGGNYSVTNTVQIICAVSNQFNLQIGGKGYIYPNYSNAVLRVGQNYTMTAYPDAGFVFTNWTGGATVPLQAYGNNPTVTFMMLSNLTMQANFIDLNKPWLSITNTTSGMVVWSNSNYTVTGLATDDQAMASVNFSLNGAPYKQVSSLNGWINWSAPLNLTTGTNLFSVYALATNGNLSVTDTVQIVYAVSNQLNLKTMPGIIYPNYSNAWLRVGQNYTMTAYPNYGFIFTNWTGGNTTPLQSYGNSSTVTFMMLSNLTMQANFLEWSKPTLMISSPLPGTVMTNPQSTVVGTTTDPWQVAGVLYSLNNGPWTPTTTTNNFTNWTSSVALNVGTNTFRAYAMNLGGNYSATNTVQIVYAVSNQLNLQIAGKGYIYPNYSNAWLRIGENYTTTAYPVAGFVFTNWTGGTTAPLQSYGNNPTVTFMMQTNLTMQANFIDLNKPWLSITNTTSGMVVWTNSNYTVTGLATDDQAMASVNFSLNGTPYKQVSSLNGWTNWSATLALAVGTNLFSVYALAANGNFSVTDTVQIVYAVSNQLNLQSFGQCEILPNYSNAWLRIGQNYTVTAYPYNGFIFSNWTEGTSAPLQPCGNFSTVTFMMQSNLTLQANLIEWSKPILTISSPLPGAVLTNSQATVIGTTTDPWQVGNVSYSLNNGPWTLATTTNNFTNWTSSVALNVGTNTFRAYAMNLGGNYSATNTVQIVYAVSNQLNLQIAGKGYIYLNYSNAWLRIGQNYTMTAYPDAGFAFTNWTGGITAPLQSYGNNPTVTFMMQTNLTMQANFIDLNKPWLSITNTTSGMVVWSNSNYTVTGLATDDQAMASVNFSLNGAPYTNVLSSDGWTNWSAPLNLTAGTNIFSVYALAANGNFSATNIVDIVYAVSNQLNLQSFGLCEIYPSYSNAWLRIGQNYTTTAYPYNGFIFSNWTESTGAPFQPCGNYSTVTFMMQTNLTLQANLIEWSKPTLTISSPLSGTHLSNSLATVIGTTTDPWQVATVNYRLNNGAWTPTTTTNNFTNWTSSVQLVAGTNTLNFYAVNLGGNYSTTNNLTLFSSNAVSMQLTFGAQQTVSHGMSFNLSMSPNLSGRILVSTDLINWSVLSTFTTGTNSTISFYDPNATNSQRFYRAVSP
jgi:hypothetical protein